MAECSSTNSLTAVHLMFTCEEGNFSEVSWYGEYALWALEGDFFLEKIGDGFCENTVSGGINVAVIRINARVAFENAC